MAVTNTRVDSDLVITVKVGTKPSGADDLRNFKFSKLKIDTTDEAVYAIGASRVVLSNIFFNKWNYFKNLCIIK